MYHNGFKILGLAGSLRRASFHRGLIRSARELAPESVAVETYEGLDKIPFFNQDVEQRVVVVKPHHNNPSRLVKPPVRS